MEGTNLVTEIVEILVAGISELGSGIGSGITNFVQSLAFVTVGEGTSATTSISPYFVLVLVFAGVALAVGLTTRIFTWLSSLGN